ncbi:MAG: hypothetical protein PHX61_07730 [Alphaproteobacteria bacterium]|nr:hypothetical protein [Alphaproteobacteria bacterium]
MAIPGPEILDKQNTADESYIRKLVKEIKYGLKAHLKQKEPQNTVTIQLEDNFGTPNFFVRNEIEKMCRAAGWASIEFKAREVKSDSCS